MIFCSNYDFLLKILILYVIASLYRNLKIIFRLQHLPVYFKLQHKKFDRNFDSFSCGFSPHNMPNILCFTETWFAPSLTSEIPGYVGHHVTREGRSGGVSIYVKQQINSKILCNLSYATSTIEVCTVEVSIKNSIHVIIGVYRPHSDSISNFNSHLVNFLENV